MEMPRPACSRQLFTLISFVLGIGAGVASTWLVRPERELVSSSKSREWNPSFDGAQDPRLGPPNPQRDSLDLGLASQQLALILASIQVAPKLTSANEWAVPIEILQLARVLQREPPELAEWGLAGFEARQLASRTPPNGVGAILLMLIFDPSRPSGTSPATGSGHASWTGDDGVTVTLGGRAQITSPTLHTWSRVAHRQTEGLQSADDLFSHPADAYCRLRKNSSFRFLPVPDGHPDVQTWNDYLEWRRSEKLEPHVSAVPRSDR